MSTATRLAGFALVLVALFGAAYTLGHAVGPGTVPNGTFANHNAGHDGHTHEHGGGAAGEEHPVGGLAVAENGYRLRRLSPDPVAGQQGELAFQVIGPNDQPVRSFVNTHDKPLHLIVVRRDLTGFQHLHPARDATGTWRVSLGVATAGDYRMFADFVPDGRTDTLVLGTDLTVAGDYRPVPLPAPVTEATADGYTVRMSRDGEAMRFTVSRNGVPVTDLEPYLAAYGHLVALRRGDLGYLHVHPDGGPGLSAPGPQISFLADLPSVGTYRLYLNFAHRGAVHTAEFTVADGEVR